MQMTKSKGWPWGQDTNIKPAAPTANVRGSKQMTKQSGSGGGAHVVHSREGTKVEPKVDRVNPGSVMRLGAHDNLKNPPPLLERGAASPQPKACTVHRSGAQGKH